MLWIKSKVIIFLIVYDLVEDRDIRVVFIIYIIYIIWIVIIVINGYFIILGVYVNDGVWFFEG